MSANLSLCLLAALSLTTVSSFALGDATKATSGSGIMEEMYVTGGRDAVGTLSGSATLIEETEIAKFVTIDLNAMLTKVPGAYIRQEDGYGLRPNINLRGTSSDRSSKITIMEDGILIGPAPYSAPAAYYVPNVSRMQALEVSKGPAAIRFGPHTVGGALNFVTRDIAEDPTGEMAVSLGSDGFERYRGFYGQNSEDFGFWVDGLRFGSDGYKTIDGGGDTGFVRNDINAKFVWRLGEPGDLYQEFNVKLGYADEDADETYLGLTDSDFDQDANRRYAASALDSFVSDRQQIQLIHSIDFNDKFKIVTRAYHHRFNRSWNKVDGIIEGPEIASVLASPDFFREEVRLLRGETDSSALSAQRIDITDNDRSFEVSGIDSQLSFGLEMGQWRHDWTVGLRLHQDKVERDHQQRGYLMQNAELVFDGDTTRAKKALNVGEADALSAFVTNSMSYGDWRFDLGVRLESISMDFDERAEGKERRESDSQHALMPGLGIFYQFNDALGFLAGINGGFSPKAPSAAADVDPEESVNYELGLRYQQHNSTVELIGFFSDYENLIGRCRASDPCAGEEFNGGAVEVEGVEFSASHRFDLSESFTIPVQLVYTHTQSEFQNSFESSFSQWGDVDAGDSLPYLPENQGRLDIGVEHTLGSINLAVKYIDKMREEAGSGEYEIGNFTEALTTMDLSLSYFVNTALSLKFVVENLADEQKIVSRRPFGARPNLPRTLKAEVAYRF